VEEPPDEARTAEMQAARARRAAAARFEDES